MVLNGRVDASHSHDLGILIAKDASAVHSEASAGVEIHRDSDGAMTVTGPQNPAGSLMILAIRYDPMGGGNIVREVVNIGRWKGGETAFTVPPMTSEAKAGCETICVVQEAGAGGIAGGTEA